MLAALRQPHLIRTHLILPHFPLIHTRSYRVRFAQAVALAARVLRARGHGSVAGNGGAGGSLAVVLDTLPVELPDSGVAGSTVLNRLLVMQVPSGSAGEGAPGLGFGNGRGSSRRGGGGVGRGHNSRGGVDGRNGTSGGTAGGQQRGGGGGMQHAAAVAGELPWKVFVRGR